MTIVSGAIRAGRWAGLVAVIGALFSLGYWARGLSVDVDKRELLAQYNQALEEKKELREEAKRLTGELQRQAANAERVAADYTARRNEDTKRISELTARAATHDQQRAILGRIQAMEQQRRETDQKVGELRTQAITLSARAATSQDHCDSVRKRYGAADMSDGRLKCARAASDAEELSQVRKDLQGAYSRINSLGEDISALTLVQISGESG